MNVLIVINDAPYGSERCYNALRVAHAVQKQESTEVTVFLMADAISAAKRGRSHRRVTTVSSGCSGA
jgi:uncharacterized protein involved in oxidation of intracellular sulfur